MARSALALAAVLLAAGAAFAAVTAGFSAVTSDGIRRVQLRQSPRDLPALALVDAQGREFPLADYGRGGGRLTIFVSLVYLKCQSVCRTTVAGQSWLQHAIASRGLQDRLRLLTLSFDPYNDTPAVMRGYAGRMGAQPASWRFATVRDPADLQGMLDLFGIVVLPDGMGGYVHNAALFMIDETGRLARAYDIDRPDLALADYLQQQRERHAGR